MYVGPSSRNGSAIAWRLASAVCFVVALSCNGRVDPTPCEGAITPPFVSPNAQPNAPPFRPAFASAYFYPAADISEITSLDVWFTVDPNACPFDFIQEPTVDREVVAVVINLAGFVPHALSPPSSFTGTFNETQSNGFIVVSVSRTTLPSGSAIGDPTTYFRVDASTFQLTITDDIGHDVAGSVSATFPDGMTFQTTFNAPYCTETCGGASL